MIEDGLFERFPCNECVWHARWPGLPFGKFAINHGPMMASSDNFEIISSWQRLACRHAGRGIDSLVCASHLVMGLQTIVSRHLAAKEVAVLSVTQIHGGDAR